MWALHSFQLHRPLSGVYSFLFLWLHITLARKDAFVLKIKSYSNGKNGLLIKSIRRIWEKSFRKANAGNFQLADSE